MTDIDELIEPGIKMLAHEEGKPVPDMSPELVLLDSGLDSLGFAVLVTRLYDELGYDPFSLMEEAVYPRTLGDFVAIYKTYAPQR